MEIVRGGESHYGVELRLTIRELDMIVGGLNLIKCNEGSDADLLRKDFAIMANLTRIKSLRKFGTFDDSRLNWK